MAYSDYGAFVYEDGQRRRDREDVAIYEEGCDSPSGARIYEHIASSIGDARDETLSDDAIFAGRCHHAVLGDGPVRVGCLKQGVGDVYVLDEATGDVKRYGCEEIVRANLGDSFVEYDDSAPAKPTDEMSAQELDEYCDRNDAHFAQYSGPYDYSFDVDGAHVEFFACARDEDADIAVYPRYHAKLVERDGSVWHGFYDSLYGAGHTDVMDGVNKSAFDALSDERPFRVSRLRVRAVDTHAYEDAPDIDASISAVYKADGRLLYRGEEAFAYVDGEPTLSRCSTLSRSDSFVSPDDFVEVLNLGISLARQGIDEIIVDSGSWGGSHEGLDDVESTDRSLSTDKIDFDANINAFNRFERFNKEFREVAGGSRADGRAAVCDDASDEASAGE